MTHNEMVELSRLTKNDMVKLFEKFGIAKLVATIGYPKGPYFEVSADVYGKIDAFRGVHPSR